LRRIKKDPSPINSPVKNFFSSGEVELSVGDEMPACNMLNPYPVAKSVSISLNVKLITTAPKNLCKAWFS